MGCDGFNAKALECLDHYIRVNRETERVFVETGDRSSFSTGDTYIDNVHLYHNIDRRYEGFIFLLEDYFMGERSVTWEKYRLRAPDTWGPRDYMFLIYAHRIFGSGTSNEANHGYHNCRLLEAQHHEDRRSFMSWLETDAQPFVSSRVNQPPRYPLKRLVADHFEGWADHVLKGVRPGMSLRDVVDHMNEYNRNHGLHRFNFHYLLMAADLANYVNLDTPIQGLLEIDEWSPSYLGPTAKAAMAILKKGYKYSDFETLCERYSMKPMDLEDLLCVWLKYIKNPVWEYYVREHHGPDNFDDHFDNGWDLVEKHPSYERVKNKVCASCG